MLPYQQWVLTAIKDNSPVKGKRILEVGGVTVHQGVAEHLIGLGAREVVQINSRKDLPESCFTDEPLAKLKNQKYPHKLLTYSEAIF